MGGVAGALERKRVNLTLEVAGGMWVHARPLSAHDIAAIEAGARAGTAAAEL